MYLKKFFFLIFFVIGANCFTAKSDINGCKVESFNLQDSEPVYIKNRIRSDSVCQFYVNFFIKTEEPKIHITLFSKGSPSYTLILGESFTNCELYSSKNHHSKNRFCSICDPGIRFSLREWTYLGITMLMNGTFILQNGNTRVLNYKFLEASMVDTLGFYLEDGGTVDWAFNCNETIKNETDSKIMESYASSGPLEQLKEDLLFFYDPDMVPNGKINRFNVTVNFRIENILTDDNRGELKLFGVAYMKWMDTKMKWKPRKYSGISSIYVPASEIWTPNLRVVNQFASVKLLDLKSSMVKVSYDGSITWRPLFKSSSFCWPNFNYWPNDYISCRVLFGFWMEPPNLSLVVMNEYDKVHTNKTEGKWKVKNIISFHKESGNKDSYGGVHVVLLRKKYFNTISFYCLHLIAVILSLSTFWVSSGSPFKLHLICGSIELLLLMFLFFVHYIPRMPKDVPYLILAYSWTTVIACFPLLLFVILKNLPESLLYRLSNLLDYAILDRIFCLPANPGQNADLNVDESISNKISFKVARVKKLIERFSFFVYLILWILMMTFI